MKTKRFLAAILLSLIVPVLLGNISWANDADNEYTLDRAIAQALDYTNPAIKEIEWKENDARNALSSAQESYSSVSKSVYPEEWYKAYAAMRVAEANLDIARRTKETSTTQLTLQVKQAYFEAVLAQKALDLARKKINQTNELFTIAKTRYNKGLSSKKEYLTAQVNLATSQTDMAEAERQRDLAFLNLKNLINADLDQNLVLTSKLTYEPMEEINIQSFAAQAAEESNGYLQAKDMLEAYKDIVSEATDNTLTNTTTYANADTQAEKWENQLELARKDAQLAVYKAYVNLKKSEDKLKTLEKQIELAEEVAKVARLSYKAGTGTLNDANEAMIKLEETKFQYQQALQAYNTAKASFEAGIF